jgi:hypothetical protein
VSPSIPPTPADLERLAGLLRHELTGAEVVVLPSPYSADPRGAVRIRLGRRAFLDLADDGAAWFVAGLWSDQGGETPPAERRRELLAVPLRADPPVVATAVVASVWRWAEAIGPQEADAPFTRTSRSAPPAIPGPGVFGAPAPAPYATAAPAPYATAAPAPYGTAAPPPYGTAAPAPYGTAAPAPYGTVAPGTAWSAPSARPPRRSRGLLIGGLVAAGLLVLAGGTVAAVAVAHSAAELASASTSPGGGSGTSGGVPDTSAYDVEVGDCFALGLGTDRSADEVEMVDLQTCDDEHDNEAYAALEATQPSWPGDDDLAAFADEGCYDEFEAFVGIPWDESVADFGYLSPTEQSWSEGDREVLCYVYIDGDTSPGSLEDYAY